MNSADMIAFMMAMDAAQQGGTGDSYTKAETDALLGGKADLVNGVVPISQIPPAAIERMITVQDDTARFALTTDDVQLGDTVKVVSTNKMYLVVDTDHLDSAAGYSVYVAGRAAEAVADEDGNNIKSTYAKIANLANVATSGSYDDLINKPTIPTVDQSYSASSTNAQSGTAVAQAVSGKISATDYATQTTGGTIKAWTTTDGSDTILHLATQ